MTLIKAEQKFVRISPRKVRLVASLIRGLSIDQAQDQLKVSSKRAALPLKKTLQQAVANAVNNYRLPKESLAIKSIQIGEAPTFKRWQPVSRGRAHPILKRTSHIKIILESQAQEKKMPAKPKPIRKIIKPKPTRSKQSNQKTQTQKKKK